MFNSAIPVVHRDIPRKHIRRVNFGKPIVRKNPLEIGFFVDAGSPGSEREAMAVVQPGDRASWEGRGVTVPLKALHARLPLVIPIQDLNVLYRISEPCVDCD